MAAPSLTPSARFTASSSRVRCLVKGLSKLAEGDPADTHRDPCRTSRFREREGVAHGSDVLAEAARNEVSRRHASGTGQQRSVTGGARERPGGHVQRAHGLAPLVASGQPLDRLRPDGVCSLELAMHGHGDESMDTLVAPRAPNQELSVPRWRHRWSVLVLVGVVLF